MGVFGDTIGKVGMNSRINSGVTEFKANQQQGLAAQSVGANSTAASNNIPMGDVGSTPVTGGATTSVSGITNPAANSMMFGNRTNGSGLMNGQITQSFGGGLAAMANSGGLQPQQNANQYSIVGGANMMV